MNYSSILIENFRGISKLELSDLKKINLLVGRNNCGKTSILEAIFLLSGMSNPQLPINIHSFRNLILTKDEDFQFMFYNFDFKKRIHIQGFISDKSRELNISPIYESSIHNNGQKEFIMSRDSVGVSQSSTEYTIEGIKLDFKNHKNENYQCTIKIKENKLNLATEYKEDLICTYLNHSTTLNVNEKNMESLLVQKDLSKILEILREIEPRINDIRMGAKGMVFVDIGKDQYYPINIMGDGMGRVLNILAAIYSMKNGIVLIDEMETGLHHKSLKTVWKAILSASKKYNVQVIAVTHSYECIEALSSFYKETSSNDDEIRLFRIDKEEESYRAFKYSSDLLESGVTQSIEVR
jgi:AAA15 family ATPase/GTPase